jgi:hypothetical protein
VKFWGYFLEVLGLNHGCLTSYSETFHGFPQSLQENARVIGCNFILSNRFLFTICDHLSSLFSSLHLEKNQTFMKIIIIIIIIISSLAVIISSLAVAVCGRVCAELRLCCVNSALAVCCCKFS